MSRAAVRRALVIGCILALVTGCTAAPPSQGSATASGMVPAAPAEPVRPATFAYAGELTQGGWVKGTAPAGTRSLALDGTPVALASDGSFFAAFDRDAGPVATLIATLRSGALARQPLTIVPRAWAIENVNIARRESGPTEVFMALRRPELARIEAARLRQTGAAGWRQDFIWPVKARISGRFGSQRVYRGEPGAYHSGIDIAGGSGTAFVAPADGVVILAAETPFTLEGNLLMIDVTPTVELVKELREKTGQRITILSIVAKAMCIAAARTPVVNSRWDAAANEIVQFGYINLGIAVATPRGLLVPNITDADALSLSQLTDAIYELATTARDGATSPASLSGGTISITNIGVFGVDAGTPILMPGEAAILAMGATRRTPWEFHGEIALRDVMTLSLSFDHRMVDGAEGSKFLAEIGAILSNPGMVLTMV